MFVTIPRSIDWRLVALAVLVVALSEGAVGRLRAATPQQPQAGPQEDVLPALLAEVRGLRAAMEQMASAGPRIQLFVARLQLEEARINTMVRRLDGVHDSLGSAQRELETGLDQQKRLEIRMTENPNGPDRDELTQVAAHARREVADRRALVTRLTAEEAQLTQDLSAEQARWTEINQRLDELERALVKR